MARRRREKMGSSKGLIPYPPRGWGGWVPDFSGLRLYAGFQSGLSPMLEHCPFGMPAPPVAETSVFPGVFKRGGAAIGLKPD